MIFVRLNIFQCALSMPNEFDLVLVYMLFRFPEKSNWTCSILQIFSLLIIIRKMQNIKNGFSRWIQEWHGRIITLRFQSYLLTFHKKKLHNTHHPMISGQAEIFFLGKGNSFHFIQNIRVNTIGRMIENTGTSM